MVLVLRTYFADRTFFHEIRSATFPFCPSSSMSCFDYEIVTGKLMQECTLLPHRLLCVLVDSQSIRRRQHVHIESRRSKGHLAMKKMSACIDTTTGVDKVSGGQVL